MTAYGLSFVEPLHSLVKLIYLFARFGITPGIGRSAMWASNCLAIERDDTLRRNLLVAVEARKLALLFA